MVRPEMCSRFSIDKLTRDANATPGLADATFKYVAHTKLAANLLHVHGPAFVSKTRIACDHKQPTKERQRHRDVLHDAIGEILMLRIRAQIGEGEDGDRGFIGKRERGFRQFRRIVGDIRTRGPLRFPHLSDETKTLARQCLDEALFLAGIADRTAGDIQTGRQRRIGHDTSIPDDVDEIVFADDALPVADQVIEQVEYLWRDRDYVRPAMQLA